MLLAFLFHKLMNPACPLLPVPDRKITVADMKKLGKRRDGEFYWLALNYAQTLWQEELPAQALLLINRALGCELAGETELLTQWPLPYRAVVWILRNTPSAQFIGNPRRHYQHLATRMVEPRRELRMWRAWACWWLACRVLNAEDYPADERQLAEENLREPTREEIIGQLKRLGLPDEVAVWETAEAEALLVDSL